MISVVIPTLNEEKYLEPTLKALRNQTYNKKFEIIVVDYNSKDRTKQIAEKYADKVITTKKKGIAAGRNAGAKIAKGNIYTFIDADTIVLPNVLNEIDKLFQKRNDLTVASVVTLPMSSSLSNIMSYWFINSVQKNSSKYGRPMMPGFCLSCRKKAFHKINGFDEKLKAGEEVDLSMRLSKLGNADVLETTVAFTSTRRSDKNGHMKSMYQWFKGLFMGKIFGDGSYESVR